MIKMNNLIRLCKIVFAYFFGVMQEIWASKAAKFYKGAITVITFSSNVHKNTVGRLWSGVNKLLEDLSNLMDINL